MLHALRKPTGDQNIRAAYPSKRSRMLRNNGELINAVVDLIRGAQRELHIFRSDMARPWDSSSRAATAALSFLDKKGAHLRMITTKIQSNSLFVRAAQPYFSRAKIIVPDRVLDIGSTWEFIVADRRAAYWWETSSNEPCAYFPDQPEDIRYWNPEVAKFLLQDFDRLMGQACAIA